MTTPDIQSLVESVLRLDKEATAGPFSAHEMHGEHFIQSPLELKVCIAGKAYRNAAENMRALATFRTAAPILANEVIRLRAELETERRKVEWRWTMIDDTNPASIPDHMGYYLVACEGGNVDTSFFALDPTFYHGKAPSRKSVGKYSRNFELSQMGYRIIAWMKRPEAPTFAALTTPTDRKGDGE